MNRYLDISTAHVTERDMDLLTRFAVGKKKSNPNGLCPVYPYDYHEGSFVVLPGIGCDADMDELMEELTKFGFSEDFKSVVRVAYTGGADMIRLDCDGEVIKTLKTNDW